MGIDTAFRKFLSQHPACKDYFRDIPYGKGRFNCGVYIMDILTRLFGAYNYQTEDKTFTGVQLYAWLRPIVWNCLNGNREEPHMNCHTVVICMDDQKRVPVEKSREQGRRNKTRTAEPLPNGCTFCDGGVMMPGVTDPALAVPFDIERVMANRSLRGSMFLYLVDMFRKTFRVMHGQTLVFDFEPEGAQVCVEGTWGRDLTSCHPFGEADLMMMYWAGRFMRRNEPCNIYIDSTDSDMMPLTAILLDHFVDLRPLRGLNVRYWRDTRKNKIRNMDAVGLFDFVTSHMGWSVRMYVTFLCLCGSDFTDPKIITEDSKTERRQLFHGISSTTVFEVFQTIDNLESYMDAAPTNLRAFTKLVRAVYTRVLTDSKTRYAGITAAVKQHHRQVMEQRGWVHLKYKYLLESVNKGKLCPPPVKTLMEIQSQLRFNLRYWFQDWSAIIQHTGAAVSEGTALVSGAAMDMPSMTLSPKALEGRPRSRSRSPSPCREPAASYRER